MSFFKLERYKKAIECYDKALEIKPDYAYAWYNKGNALNSLGKYNEAIEADRAIQIDPNHTNAWYNKGWHLDKLGKDKDANRCFDKARQLK